MRGINEVTISGNAGGKFSFGKTQERAPAFSFWVIIEGGRKPEDKESSDSHPSSEHSGETVIWVKVNCFGPLADLCDRKLSKGMYVIVSGSLMNRRTVDENRAIEVKARKIIFVDERRERGDDRE